MSVKPTLFIGFGGTGARVLQTVKYALAKRFSPDGQTVPACFSFLAVDPDISSAREFDSVGNYLGFDVAAGNEFLVADLGGNYEYLESRIQNDTLESFRAVSTLWPKGLGNRLQRGWGEVRPVSYRQLGRAAFWLNACGRRGFRERIRSAVDTMTDPQVQANVVVKHPQIKIINGQDFDIIVVSSLAGVTGCGMLIDGLANIRDMVRMETRILTFMLMPSVYQARIQNEYFRKATQINAYAALKEFDQFMRTENDFSYEEAYSKECIVNFNRRLSSLTYLIGAQTEDGQNCGGEGHRVIGETAEFITHSVLGFASAENQFRNALELVAGTIKLQPHNDCHPVAKAYSSFGLYDLEYPQDHLASYARNYAIQLMLAQITEEPSAGEEKLRERIKSMIHGSGETDIWQDELIPAIPYCPTSFSHATPDQFSAIKRKDVLNTVFYRYQESKSKIDRHYKNLDNTMATASEVAISWILGKAKELFLDPNFGLGGAIRLLEEIKSDVHVFISMCRDEAEKENGTTLSHIAIRQGEEIYSDVARMLFRSNREKRLASLLPILQADLTDRNKAYSYLLAAKVAGRILERAINPLLDRLDALKYDMRTELSMARSLVQKKNEALMHLFMTGECFGCSEADIKTLESKVKKEVRKQDSAFRNAVMADFAWNSQLVEPFAEALVNSVHGKGHFFERLKACVVDNLSDYLAAHARRASPMCEYLGGEHECTIFYYMISRFTEKEIARYTNGNMIPGVGLIRLNHMEPNKVTFVAVRHGMPAAYVKEVVSSYKVYKIHNGVPYSQLGFTAHVMRDAEKWSELVYEIRNGIDVHAYIRLCRKLGLLKRDTKGQFYTLFLLDAEDGKWRFNGLVNVKKALADEEGLAQAVQKSVVTKLCERFVTNSSAFLSWSADNEVPDEIVTETKKRLSLI